MNKFSFLALSIAVSSLPLVAGDLKFNGKLATSYIKYDVDTQRNPESGADIFTVSPSIGAVYNSSKLLSRLTANNNQVFRNFSGIDTNNAEEEPKKNNNYTNYNFFSQLNIIDNLLNVHVASNQSYQDRLGLNDFTTDIVFNSDQLSKTRTNTLGFNLNLERAKYVGALLRGTASNIKSDRQINGQELNTNSKSVSASVFSGERLKRITWNIDASYFDSNGRNNNNNNLISRRVNANLYFGVWRDFKLVLTGQTEHNNYNTTLSPDSIDLQYNSYGAGFSWDLGLGRNIEITYNKPSSSNSALPNVADNSNESFIGGRINWQFSKRTGLNANFSRRFFGNSKNYSLYHRNKHWRTSIAYGENLTSFARLITTRQDLGTFVCPLGQELNLSDCFQPSVEDYQLAAGEQFINMVGLTPEISNEARLIKNLTASMGYDLRRLKVSLNLNKFQTRYLDSNRFRDGKNVVLTTNYKMGVKTSVSWRNSYSEYDFRQDSTLKTTQSALGLNYSLSKKLKTSVEFQYSHRESEVSTLDFRNRRLTLRLQYLYK